MKIGLRLSFQKGDWIAILLVAILSIGTAVAFILPSRNAQDALVQIYQDGRLVKESAMDTDAEFEISGRYTNHIFIQDGKAAIVDSDCPGQDCMHSGWIAAAGRSIVCLPNRVEVRIVGAASDVDFSVG